MLTQDRVMGTQALLIASLWFKIALKQNGLLRHAARVIVLILLEV